MDPLQEAMDGILTLTTEDGGEEQFEYLDVIEYEGEEYLLLLPLETDTDEVIILRIQPLEGDDEEYVPVENQETLLAVYAIFKDKFKDILTFKD